MDGIDTPMADQLIYPPLRPMCEKISAGGIEGPDIEVTAVPYDA
jgi:hypothetical protein